MEMEPRSRGSALMVRRTPSCSHKLDEEEAFGEVDGADVKVVDEGEEGEDENEGWPPSSGWRKPKVTACALCANASGKSHMGHDEFAIRIVMLSEKAAPFGKREGADLHMPLTFNHLSLHRG